VRAHPVLPAVRLRGPVEVVVEGSGEGCADGWLPTGPGAPGPGPVPRLRGHQVLLLASCLPQRAYGVEVVGATLRAAAEGDGCRCVAARIAVGQYGPGMGAGRRPQCRQAERCGERDPRRWVPTPAPAESAAPH
jgi:hypothetical protein